MRGSHRQRCTRRDGFERCCAWGLGAGDRSEDAVEILSQLLGGSELSRFVRGAVGAPFGQQSCSARPQEEVVRAGEIVSREARPRVDRIDEIDDSVVTGEVERPTRRDRDDPRTIPDQCESQVSSEVPTLTVATIAPCHVDHR